MKVINLVDLMPEGNLSELNDEELPSMSRSRVKRVTALKQEQIKTPGSPYAVEHGCTCSPVGNNYGHGVDSCEPRFVIAPGCPMHDFDEDEYCWVHDLDMEARG